MNYLDEAFGAFSPQVDGDAALKFSLAALMADRRIRELLRLVGEVGFGGVEGPPGWIIERREPGELIGYESWPPEARYRAYVEPESYSLAFPEFYCDRPTFLRHVQSVLAIYARHYTGDEREVSDLKEILSHELP